MSTLTPEAPPASHRPAGPAGRSAPASYRPEIDGVRALAVIAVVAYHAGVPGFGGGFIGVDVFFVISGFLITGLLAREVAGSGRVSVAAFYGRRARRLLPVAALVSVVTVAVGWWVVSPLARRDLAADALATSTYTINLRLAFQQLDYLRADLAPSAFQQFWSLAVEEQFYLIWPLLMMVALRGAQPRRRAAVVMGVVAGVSLVASVALSQSNPPWAFFSLGTRAWQLALGGLLGLGYAAVDDRVSPRLRRWGAALGLGLIVTSIAVFSTATPWPGLWALVPTAGALLVLAGPALEGGSQVGGDGVAGVLAARPVRWVGVRSYSWYLWHWPAMVFIAAILDRDMGGWPAVVVGVVALGLAHLTYRWVENPVRTAPRLVASPRRSLLLGVGVTVVLAVSFAVLMTRQGDIFGPGAVAVDPAQEALDAVLLDRAGLVEEVPSNLSPSLSDVHDDLPLTYGDGCHLEIIEREPKLCEYGDTRSDRTVVLFGDSHAAQWFPALDSLGRQDHFRLVTLTKSACPAADISVYYEELQRAYTECDDWRAAAMDEIAGLDPDLIIVSHTSRYKVAGGSHRPPTDEEWRSSLRTTFDRLAAVGHTVVLGDTPYPSESAPGCLSDNLSSVTNCVSARRDLLQADKDFAALEAEVADEAGIPMLPTIGMVCGRVRCPVIVGRVLVYRDSSHLSTVYVEHLTERLDQLLIRPTLGDGDSG